MRGNPPSPNETLPLRPPNDESSVRYRTKGCTFALDASLVHRGSRCTRGWTGPASAPTSRSSGGPWRRRADVKACSAAVTTRRSGWRVAVSVTARTVWLSAVKVAAMGRAFSASRSVESAEFEAQASRAVSLVCRLPEIADSQWLQPAVRCTRPEASSARFHAWENL